MIVLSSSRSSSINRSTPAGNQFCINKPLCVHPTFVCAASRIIYGKWSLPFVLFLACVWSASSWFIPFASKRSFRSTLRTLSPRSTRFLTRSLSHSLFLSVFLSVNQLLLFIAICPLVFAALSANSKHVSESNCFPMINISARAHTHTTTLKWKLFSFFQKKKKRIKPYSNNHFDVLFRYRFKNTQFTHRHFHCWSSGSHSPLVNGVCVTVYLRVAFLFHSFARLFIHSFCFFTYAAIAAMAAMCLCILPNVGSSTGSQQSPCVCFWKKKKQDQRDFRLRFFRYLSLHSITRSGCMYVAAAAPNSSLSI